MLLLPEGLCPGSYTPFTANNKLDEKALNDLLSTPLEFTGDAHAQTERVVNRIGAITKAHAAAAQDPPPPSQ